jgi:hypothetical protein
MNHGDKTYKVDITRLVRESVQIQANVGKAELNRHQRRLLEKLNRQGGKKAKRVNVPSHEGTIST